MKWNAVQIFGFLPIILKPPLWTFPLKDLVDGCFTRRSELSPVYMFTNAYDRDNKMIFINMYLLTCCGSGRPHDKPVTNTVCKCHLSQWWTARGEQEVDYHNLTDWRSGCVLKSWQVMTSLPGLRFCPFLTDCVKSVFIITLCWGSVFKMRVVFYLIIYMTAGAKRMRHGYLWLTHCDLWIDALEI